MKFATGPDATDSCPGGYKQHIFHGTNLRGGQTASLRVKARTAKIHLFCPGETYGSCAGTVAATASLNGVRVPIGSATFRIGPWYTGSIEIPLTKKLVHRIKRLGQVPVYLTAHSHDDPYHDKRVFAFRALKLTSEDQPPVQHKTTHAKIELVASD
jgi:hypothetical protein